MNLMQKNLLNVVKENDDVMFWFAITKCIYFNEFDVRKKNKKKLRKNNSTKQFIDEKK